MAIKYAIEKHAACFPSRVLAAQYGAHIFNIKVTNDVDNGAVVKRGKWGGMEFYAEGVGNATTTGVVLEQAANGNWYVEITDPGDGLLLYNVPMIEEEYNRTFQLEGNFYNEANDIVRGYTLTSGDIIELSEEAFDKNGQTLEADKTLKIVSKKWQVQA